ncbi:MAG: hypothetical protein SCK70_14590, partial [bacterium]|nr:hypothetical protein [bacterium]
IINLPEMVTYQLDHKKKEYRKSELEKWSEDFLGDSDEDVDDAKTEEDEPDSDIRITKSEFKVERSGESKTINGFPCKKYVVTSITEWENLKTGDKGNHRLLTDVWTTTLSGEIQVAHQQEMQFSRNYMEKIGLDVDLLQQSILGKDWFSIFRGLNPGQESPRTDESQIADEIKKIEGYPVVVDGKYYVQTSGDKAEQKEQQDITDVKDMFGRFAKKAVKKEKKDEDEPNFSYYTELLEMSTTSVDANEFQPPAKYKFKKN